MTRPPAKSSTLTKVAKAVRLPPHPLKRRLQKVLEVIDSVHAPKNLKALLVVMDGSIQGGQFQACSATGPYDIYLNPSGSHPELSFLHEIGHFLEWQAIPKAEFGPRRFSNDLLFAPWLQVVRESETIQRHFELRDHHPEESLIYQASSYLLDEAELWARAYSQYIALKKQVPIILEQIAAENKVLTGNIPLKPYWRTADFRTIQIAMDAIFQELEWSV